MNNNLNSAEQPIEPNNDLSWQAFCYVANELDAKARRQFEIRLEQDQFAREAVAQAFDNALLLNVALGSTNDYMAEPTSELPNRTSRPSKRLKPVSSKSLRPVLLTGAAAVLLGMAFNQLPWGQVGTEVTQNMETLNATVEASMSLAETWADSEWQTNLRVELEDNETKLTCEGRPRCQHKRPDHFDQDDWMTTTLIDMAESSLHSGS